MKAMLPLPPQKTPGLSQHYIEQQYPEQNHQLFPVGHELQPVFITGPNLLFARPVRQGTWADSAPP